jgi:hypothetical protein
LLKRKIHGAPVALAGPMSQLFYSGGGNREGVIRAFVSNLGQDSVEIKMPRELH